MKLSVRSLYLLLCAAAVLLLIAGLLLTGTAAGAQTSVPEAGKISSEEETAPAPRLAPAARKPSAGKKKRPAALLATYVDAARIAPEPEPVYTEQELQSKKGAYLAALSTGDENREPFPEAVPEELELVGDFISTAYYVTGSTSIGAYTVAGRTLAVNPNVIPYGSHVWIFLEDGTLVGDFYAEDTGTNMLEHPSVIDIYMGNSYDLCASWGARPVRVYRQSDEGAE